MSLDAIKPYLGDLEALLSRAGEGSDKYAQPALKNLGSVAIPIIREVIAPVSFRNADTEITDISHNGVRRVRAVANKFKYGERSRGLQILRYMKVGGAMAQNKTSFSQNDSPSKGYDLNTIVFGDSANHGKYILPVKAAAQYSDAISIQPYGQCVDDTFHNRAAEDGTLFDAEKQQNSDNLFERHFITPGTLLLQVIAFNGRTAPPLALDHLLLSIGLAGAYGGQTSIYGVNVRNNIVGVYASRFEQEIASPYVAVEGLKGDLSAIRKELDERFSQAHAARVSRGDVAAHQADMIAQLEGNDKKIRATYEIGRGKIAEYFDAWFALGKKKS
jgi:CRISPR type I-D-associated protein Csc2